MAKETKAPLTKVELTKIAKGLNALTGQVLVLVDEIHTEGISPKLAQQISYQAGMARYGVRNMEALVESLGSVPAKTPRKASPRKPKTTPAQADA